MRDVRTCLLGVWIGVLVVPGLVYGQQCVEDALCIITDERSNGVDFLVDNLLDEEIIVIIDVESVNLTGSVRFPHVGTYPGGRLSRAFTLRPKDRDAAWRYGYSFRWRTVVNRLGCKEGLFCVEVEEHDTYIEAYVENLRPFDITVQLDISLANAVADVAMPYAKTYPGQQRTPAFRLKRLDRGAAVQYKYSFQWLYGNLNARHDDAFAYALPYASGKAFPVIQGYDGVFSHQGKYAIDWDMPERTPVHATRGGVVVDVVDQYTEGGLADHLKTRANHILIQHDDGTLGNYVHLAPNGAFVAVGQRVTQGQAIGVSGNTGYSSGPHLHFEVFTVTPSLNRQTIPIRFRTKGHRAVELEEGRAYTAPLR